MRALTIIAALFVMTACGKKEAPAPSPEPAKPEATKAAEPKPEPKPEPEPTTPPPETKPPEPTTPPVDPNAGSDAAAAPNDEVTTAIKNLIEPGDEVEAKEVAVYVEETKTLYYTESYSVEGTGVGLNLLTRTDDGTITTSEIESVGGDGEEGKPPLGREGAKKLLMDTFKGKTVHVLESFAWPVENAETADAKPAKSMTLQSPAAILTFAKKAITITDLEGKELGKVDLSADAEKPHVPVMGQVFTNPKVRLLLIEVGFDPGEKYSDGYNYFSKSYVVALP